MALTRQIARLSKILVDSEGISFTEAEARLRALTLEVVVGPDATSPAAHAAVLTAVVVGRRSFIGGVRLVGAVTQRLNSMLPLAGKTLAEAATELGAAPFEGRASRRVVVGSIAPADEIWTAAAWWQDWRAGAAVPGDVKSDAGENPVAGVAAGALAVGAAFEAARGRAIELPSVVDLWPTNAGDHAPSFAEVFLPSAIWLVGLGNLGQAFLWVLATLPYANPAEVSLVLQDRDKVSEENWATSVLVSDEKYGELKTAVAERWLQPKGFDIRRVDRRLLVGDRLEDGDPRVALCGVDKIAPRKWMAETGFECIVDAGLGRKAKDFDRYRVTVFDGVRRIDTHFEDQVDEPVSDILPDIAAYRALEAEIGPCGAGEVAGASVAVPYVSAVAATVAIARLIAIASGCACRTNEVRRLSDVRPKASPSAKIEARGIAHGGRPKI